jgi:hypothetical protein
MPHDAEPPKHRIVQRDENLDVVGTSRDQRSLEPKGPPGETLPDPHLSVVCPFPAQPARQRGHRERSASMAANTFRFLKRRISLKRSTLQNQSAFPWLPISPFIGRVRSLLMIMTALALRKFVRG